MRRIWLRRRLSGVDLLYALAGQRSTVCHRISDSVWVSYYLRLRSQKAVPLVHRVRPPVIQCRPYSQTAGGEWRRPWAANLHTKCTKGRKERGHCHLVSGSGRLFELWSPKPKWPLSLSFSTLTRWLPTSANGELDSISIVCTVYTLSIRLCALGL